MKISLKDLKNAILETKTMAQAAVKLNLHFSTFKRYAIKHNLYEPNQGGKGCKEVKDSEKLQKILNGEYPEFQTYKLKLKLFNEGLKDNKCEICGITEWNNLKINCELDHIDGNRNNHIFSNLRILCPNCHSQTETFRNKRGNKTRV